MAGSPTCFALGPPTLSLSPPGPTGEDFVEMASIDTSFPPQAYVMVTFSEAMEQTDPVNFLADLEIKIDDADQTVSSAEWTAPNELYIGCSNPGSAANFRLIYSPGAFPIRSALGVDQIAINRLFSAQ